MNIINNIAVNTIHETSALQFIVKALTTLAFTCKDKETIFHVFKTHSEAIVLACLEGC